MILTEVAKGDLTDKLSYSTIETADILDTIGWMYEPPYHFSNTGAGAEPINEMLNG
ncbi:hypothetical protein Alches_23330 [Alicyclobacillus hesperidum subsp. aegles]|nr:hypothetical protein Alches_23330 [Alicyclobacillus hesperidum subsp. aegles]